MARARLREGVGVVAVAVVACDNGVHDVVVCSCQSLPTNLFHTERKNVAHTAARVIFCCHPSALFVVASLTITYRMLFVVAAETIRIALFFVATQATFAHRYHDLEGRVIFLWVGAMESSYFKFRSKPF